MHIISPYWILSNVSSIKCYFKSKPPIRNKPKTLDILAEEDEEEEEEEEEEEVGAWMYTCMLASS